MKHTLRFSNIRHIGGKALSVLALSIATQAVAQSTPDKVHIGLIYPISTHGSHAPQDTNHFSFHAIAGVSAEEKGVGFAGFSTVVKNNTNGVLFSGFSNHVGKKANGLLFAGFTNTYKGGEGFQFAGFSNVSPADIEGAQFAGFLNLSGNMKGSQFAGFSNTAKEVSGSQFAGFSNVSTRNLEGTQAAGFINVAREVEGSQLAGFINVAKKVKGVQIAGFINVADSSDHPIGIVNIIKNGEKSIGLTIDETQTTILAFRSGGKVLYGLIGAGYNFKNDEQVYAFEAGLGAHLFNTQNFRLNTEVTSQYLEDFHPGEYFKSSVKLMPGIKLANVEVFGGPALHWINTNTSEGKAMIGNYLWEHQNRWNEGFQALYIGYTAGVNIRF